MTGFGKKLRERQVPAWEAYYISYKMMKEKVNQYGQQVRNGPKEDRKLILKEFSEMLDRQVEKMVLFLLIKQGQLALQLSKLADEREADDTEGGGQIVRIKRLLDAYHAVGEDLLSLLRFVDLNATGLRKILKKFDKRVGYRLSDEYVATRSNHPFSQLQQIFRHVGIGAMVATISRNLAELGNKGRPVASIYEQRSTLDGMQDPLIESIKKAEDRLTNSASFLRFLGQQALNERDDVPAEEEEDVEGNYHLISLILNLVNTYLYMVNTYIIVPTADKYATSLGAAPTLSGVIIGSMAIAQLVSSVYLSAWSNKSYFGPLIFSSVILFLGNLLYALAYNFNSVTVLLLGRLLCGLGSARAVNRRYISDCVPVKLRLQASAAFVSASALGMASGPALAGLLEFKYTAFGLTFNANTLPGWIMAVGWALYLIWVLLGFKEPSHPPLIVEEGSPPQSADYQAVRAEKQKGEERLLEPFLSQSLKPSDIQMVDGADLNNTDSDSDDQSNRAATSFLEAYKLLTLPVKVQLYIYFMLKFAMEILLSESSIITAFYFDWGTRSVALFLALLGLTVLPVNWVVGSYASNLFQDRQLLVAAEVLTCIGLAISLNYMIVPYTVTQYVIGALVLFVSAEVLEGVNLSLLSKVMSSRLARGTYNGGLLSTEAGTLARVISDCTITLAGYLGEGKLLNTTMFPTLLIALLSIVGTLYTYDSMF